MNAKLRKWPILITCCLVAVMVSLYCVLREGPGAAAQSLLPAIDQLADKRSVSADLIDTQTIKLELDDCLVWSEGVEAQSDAIVLGSDDDSAFCVYELGPFGQDDTLAEVLVESQWIGDADISFKLAFADFGSGQWLESRKIIQGKTRSIQVPVGELVNPQGMVYLAFCADPGTAVKLKRIECSMELSAAETTSIRSSVLKSEIAGVPVAIPLEVVDGNGRLVGDYAGKATLIAENSGMSIACEVSFAAGRARPSLTFEDQGTYTLSIADAAEPLDGPLSVISIYQTELPVYSLTIDEESLRELDENPKSDQYQQGTFNIDDAVDGEVRLRYRGGSRRELDKKCWKVKFEGKASYDDPEWDYSRDTFNLIADARDSTMLREKLSYDLMQDLGVPTPRTRFIHLRVNDVFQGVYLDVENPRRNWLKAMGINAEGSMYRGQHGSLGPLSSIRDYESRYEKKMREEYSYRDLAELCTQLDELQRITDPDEQIAALEAVIDLDTLTHYFVGLDLVSGRENWVLNYYLYHDAADTRKWIIFPWDVDMTWGYDNLGSLYAEQPLGNNSSLNALSKLYFGNEVLRANYFAELRYALDSCFKPREMDRRIDSYYRLICKDVAADWQKKELNEDYHDKLVAMKRYVRDRANFIREELALRQVDPMPRSARGKDAAMGYWLAYHHCVKDCHCQGHTGGM